MSAPVRVSLSVALLLAAVFTMGDGRARAAYEPVQLLSTGAEEQADSAIEPAISADGRYVAFAGTVGGQLGIFRKDLQTGALRTVVSRSAYSTTGPLGSARFSGPDISADGRYVSFTTTATLADADNPAPPAAPVADSDVYVADLATPTTSFELASALNGCDPAASAGPCGLTYGSGGSACPADPSATAGGSCSTAAASLSADGRKVAFFTTARSNLTGSPLATEAPAGQIAVRDLATRETTLVSVKRDRGTGATTGLPVPEGALPVGRLRLASLVGAALSADGSTVAWLGYDLPDQVPLLSGEATAISAQDANFGEPYLEPLWRRVPTAGEPAPPTRRIVGGDDLFPNLTKLPPQTCAMTPGWIGHNAAPEVDGVPSLSADGRTVALIGQPNQFANVFLVDMADGLGRREAVRQLTREIPVEEPCFADREDNAAGAGSIYSVSISADGRHLAFATARQRFPLAPPFLFGAPPSSVGVGELYGVDLERETLELITRRADGGPSNCASCAGNLVGTAGANSPTLSADGRVVAFASIASNLAPGDANGASDVFDARARAAEEKAGDVRISPPPAAAQLPSPRWRMWVGARSLPDGRVLVRASVPGSGKLRVRALQATATGGRARSLLSASRRAPGAGVVTLSLRLKRRWQAFSRSRDGLAATLRVSFASRGNATLRDQLEALFRRRPAREQGAGGGSR